MMGTYKTCKITLKSDSCVILAKYKPVSGINMNLATQRVSFLIYREAVSGENTKEVNVCTCVGKQELDAVHSRCSRLYQVHVDSCKILQKPTVLFVWQQNGESQALLSENGQTVSNKLSPDKRLSQKSTVYCSDLLILIHCIVMCDGRFLM